MIYLDASVVFSLHFTDGNTPAALALAGGAGVGLVLTSLSELEAINAFALRVFRKEMSVANMGNAVRDLQTDIQSGILDLQPLPESAYSRAKTLAQALTPTLGVRAADLLHVSAALELGAKSFYTFDRKQHSTAKAAGLHVNPLP